MVHPFGWMQLMAQHAEEKQPDATGGNELDLGVGW